MRECSAPAYVYGVQGEAEVWEAFLRGAATSEGVRLAATHFAQVREAMTPARTSVGEEEESGADSMEDWVASDQDVAVDTA